MNIDDKLNKLKNIGQADTPPFLFTRIRQRIENLTDVPAPVRWRFTFISGAIILLILNMAILIRSVRVEKRTDIEQVVKSMQLSSSNDLYHE